MLEDKMSSIMEIPTTAYVCLKVIFLNFCSSEGFIYFGIDWICLITICLCLQTFSYSDIFFFHKCKYMAESASDFCREENHSLKTVKAKKRFFECKNCKRRTTSLDKLPRKACGNCDHSSWQRVAMGKVSFYITELLLSFMMITPSVAFNIR